MRSIISLHVSMLYQMKIIIDFHTNMKSRVLYKRHNSTGLMQYRVHGNVEYYLPSCFYAFQMTSK